MKKSVQIDDSADEGEFEKECLKVHNEYRKKHGVEPLKINKELTALAKDWVTKIATKDTMEHRPDNKFGENIYGKWSTEPGFKIKGNEPVDSWYEEIKFHPFGQEPSSLKSGHFTQVIWKDTKEMGVAKMRNQSGNKILVVANYNPPGNFIGKFAECVPQVGGFKELPKAAKEVEQTKPKKGLMSGLFKSKANKNKTSDDDSSSDEEDFAEKCLQSHNEYRKKHGVTPLKIDKKLSKFSKEWAVQIAENDRMEHRPNNSYGENIYCMWSSNPKFKVAGKDAVDSWYNEIKDHTFGKEPSSLGTGHFTQVIWRDSKELGVGKARCKSSGKIYVVANYNPPGNFIGKFSECVPKPQ